MSAKLQRRMLDNNIEKKMRPQMERNAARVE